MVVEGIRVDPISNVDQIFSRQFSPFEGPDLVRAFSTFRGTRLSWAHASYTYWGSSKLHWAFHAS